MAIRRHVPSNFILYLVNFTAISKRFKKKSKNFSIIFCQKKASWTFWTKKWKKFEPSTIDCGVMWRISAKLRRQPSKWQWSLQTSYAKLILSVSLKKRYFINLGCFTLQLWTDTRGFGHECHEILLLTFFSEKYHTFGLTRISYSQLTDKKETTRKAARTLNKLSWPDL